MDPKCTHSSDLIKVTDNFQSCVHLLEILTMTLAEGDGDWSDRLAREDGSQLSS